MLGEGETVRVVAEWGYTQTPAPLSRSGATVELVITIKMRQATHGLEVTAWALRSRAGMSTTRQNRMTATPITRLTVSANGTVTGTTIDQGTGTQTPANQMVIPFLHCIPQDA